jgi:hypothetical protein
LKDEQYIFEINSLPHEIALKKKNSATVKKGNIIIELHKKQNIQWKNFIDPSLLCLNDPSFDARSRESDISDGFFEDIDDEELKMEMDKLIYQAMQS